MRWYGEAVDDVVSDFAAEVARRKSEAAAVAQRLKKRRISSGTGENRCVSWLDRWQRRVKAQADMSYLPLCERAARPLPRNCATIRRRLGCRTESALLLR